MNLYSTFHLNEVHKGGQDAGQTHLKYKNPLIARVLAFFNLAYFFVKILIQQGFQKYRAFALGQDAISVNLRLKPICQRWVLLGTKYKGELFRSFINAIKSQL